MNLKQGCMFFSNSVLLCGYSHRIGRELALESVVLLSECDKAKESQGTQGACREATVLTDHRIQAGQRERGEDAWGKDSEKMAGVQDHEAGSLGVNRKEHSELRVGCLELLLVMKGWEI